MLVLVVGIALTCTLGAALYFLKDAPLDVEQLLQ